MSTFFRPKFKKLEFLLISHFFGIGSVSFYFLRLKLLMLYMKKTQKRKANVSATYGGPLQCYKLNDLFKIFVKDKNIGDN